MKQVYTDSGPGGMEERRRKKRLRMWVGYSALAAMAIALSLYVGLRDRDRVRYTLPAVTAPERNGIMEISVDSSGGSAYRIVRSDETWTIQPGGYPADARQVSSMLDALAGFTVTDLVSTAGYYERYQLDEASRISVQAVGGQRVLLEFAAGRRSPSYNHTFVTLPDDTRIFQATGDLRRIFDRGIDAIRDKLVMSFDKEAVYRIAVTSSERSFRLHRTEENDTAKTTVWTSGDGQRWDADAVDDALERLSGLTCTAFAEDPDADFGQPVLVLEIMAETQETLSLYPKEGDRYPARSSYTPYPFYLSSWQGDQLIGVF